MRPRQRERNRRGGGEREKEGKRERVCVSMIPHKVKCLYSEDSEVFSLTVLGSFCLSVAVPGGR